MPKLPALLPRIAVLATTFVLAASSPPASAVETGQIRLGADYAQLYIGGKDWHPCEQACNDDSSCKAWTYVATVGQCRLKYDPGRLSANDCCVSGVKGAPAQPVDADAGDCVTRSREALAANNRNLAGHCGYVGPLWSSDYGKLFSRCLTSSPRRRDQEASDRRQALADCRDVADNGPDPGPGPMPGGSDLICDHYARMAVAETQTNRMNRCGFSGPRWSADYQAHRGWCVSNGPERARAETSGREQQLLQCLGELADARACDDYAARAMDQIARARSLRCRFGDPGVFWQGELPDQVSWCRSHAQAERDALLQRREDALARCASDHRDQRPRFIFKF